MVNQQEKSEPEAAIKSASEKAKRARYKQLTSNLMVFGYGTSIYAYLQIAIPGHRPALWVTICEVLAAIGFHALALFLVPRGEEP